MIRELSWDTAFFGRKIGRLDAVSSEDELGELLHRAASDGFAYLTCRLPASHIRDVQLLERHGFYLCDVSILWERGVEPLDAPEAGARAATLDDRGILVGIARGIFGDGRFYHDPFFSREEADRLYETWASNLLSGLADMVFIVGNEGFICCALKDGTGDIPLVGVAAGSQRKGIGTSLMRSAIEWFAEKGATEVTVRTQAGNSRALHFYERCGFSVKTVDVTLGAMLGR